MSLRGVFCRSNLCVGGENNEKNLCCLYPDKFQKKCFIYGVTSDLIGRVVEHKEKQKKGFTQRYYVSYLVYFEVFSDIRDAIVREKQIKAGSRKKKIDLIESINPAWEDLYNSLVQ